MSLFLSRCLRTLHALFCPLATRSAIFYHFGFASQRFSNEWGRRRQQQVALARMWPTNRTNTRRTCNLEEGEVEGEKGGKGNSWKTSETQKCSKSTLTAALGKRHWKSATKVKAQLSLPLWAGALKGVELKGYILYSMYRAALRLSEYWASWD